MKSKSASKLWSYGQSSCVTNMMSSLDLSTLIKTWPRLGQAGEPGPSQSISSAGGIYVKPLRGGSRETYQHLSITLRGPHASTPLLTPPSHHMAAQIMAIPKGLHLGKSLSENISTVIMMPAQHRTPKATQTPSGFIYLPLGASAQRRQNQWCIQRQVKAQRYQN